MTGDDDAVTERDYYAEALDLAIHGSRFHNCIRVLPEVAHLKALYEKLLDLQTQHDRLGAILDRSWQREKGRGQSVCIPETAEEAAKFYR